MNKKNIPQKPNEISVSWLNTVMSPQLAHDASIRTFDTEVIGEGMGFLSDIYRFTLHWDRPTGNPQSLIAKFATSNLELRALIGAHKHYENEVHFYQELAVDTPVKTPTSYLSENNSETHDTLLLLEDISTNATIDQIQGCSLSLAERAVETLAKLHGHWWEHSKLDNLPWLLKLCDPLYTNSIPEFYRNNSPIAVERLGKRVPDWYPKIQEQHANHLPNIMRQMYQYPLTLVHGDFRLDNLLLDTENGQPTLTIIDWQMTMHAPGMYDLGYFLSQSLTIKDRRANEKALLDLYYKRLCQHGVQNTSPEQIYEAYRLVCLWRLITPIVHAATFDVNNPRETEFAYCIAERAFAAIEDHNVLELLN